MIINDYCLRILRIRRGLAEDDQSMDGEFLAREPIANLREVIAYELGQEDWADVVLECARGVGMSIEIHCPLPRKDE